MDSCCRQKMELLRFLNGDCGYKVDLNHEDDLMRMLHEISRQMQEGMGRVGMAFEIVRRGMKNRT